MTNPTENPEKKPAISKIIYGITLGLLVAALVLSAGMYLWEQQSVPEEPTEQTIQSDFPSTPTTTVPPATTPGATEPEDPSLPSEPEPTLPAPITPSPVVPPVEEGKTDIRLHSHKAPVSLLGQAARDYLAAQNVTDVTQFVSRYWETESRSDQGRPVELSYTVYGLAKGVTVQKAVFRLYAPDASGRFEELEPEKGSRSVWVYNLLTGAQYPYEVTVSLSDGTVLTLSDSFQTEKGPRLMSIFGLVNVRDLGGWVTADGQTVRQGLLFRGSEMDGAVEPDFKLTAEGLEQLKALGIKTDLDLRHAGSDVIPGAEHIYYNAIQYEHAFTPAGQEAVRRLFADLAEPENYPAYLHCTYGADRTGTMCYLLLGLLGVSDADLKRDYELTAMYYGYVSPQLMDAFVEKIAALPGDTTQQRIEYFLLEAGVTPQQMQSIRQIFLG